MLPVSALWLLPAQSSFFFSFFETLLCRAEWPRLDVPSSDVGCCTLVRLCCLPLSREWASLGYFSLYLTSYNSPVGKPPSTTRTNILIRLQTTGSGWGMMNTVFS